MKFNGENYEGHIRINEFMIKDLNWWKTTAVIRLNPIRKQNYSIKIYSDLSLSGWESYCNNINTFGFGVKRKKRNHINYLELLAAFFGFKCFALNWFQCEVSLRIDYTTAISYINGAGGVQYRHLSDLSRIIRDWCKERKI